MQGGEHGVHGEQTGHKQFEYNQDGQQIEYSYRLVLLALHYWRVGKGCRLHSTGECATIGNVQKPYIIQ